MRSQTGIGMVELVVVLAVGLMLMTAAVTFSLPWNSREKMRGAVYTVQNHLQQTLIQAVTRNRACRFILEAGIGRIRVVDLNDPGNTTDDVTLLTTTLPETVTFEDPEGGAAITFTLVSGTTYQVTFASDGSVSDGAGVVILAGGERFNRLTLFGAGGLRVDTWNGSSWQAGA